MTFRNHLIFLWLLAPAALCAYHLAAGEVGMARDEAARQIAVAEAAASAEDWKGAMEAYSVALQKLPLTDRAQRWSLRLARSAARLNAGALPAAMLELDVLLQEIKQAEPASPLVEAIRANLAMGEYYAAWLMRVEGAADVEWKAELNSAREGFLALVSESASARKEYQQNLEATVWLARLTLEELRATPLPPLLREARDVSESLRSRRRGKAGATLFRASPNSAASGG